MTNQFPIGIHDLPYEIVDMILDLADYSVCQMVCKRWKLKFNEFKKFTIYDLIDYNSGSLLQWAVDNGSLIPNDICERAAQAGCLQVLIWYSFIKPVHTWSEYICCCAAESGQLEILKWLRNPTFDVNNKVIRIGQPCPWDEDTCDYAARNGHLHILQWVRSQNPPCPWNEEVFDSAAYGGHFEVVKWLRYPTFATNVENGPIFNKNSNDPCPWDENTCANAEMKKHLEILNWLKDNGCPYSDD